MADWRTRAKQRLQEAADAHFSAWATSLAGQKWRNRKRRVSPYHCGFSLPEYHHELVQALNRDDEHTAKRLILDHFIR